MTDLPADERISLKVELNDEEVADQIEEWLREQDVSDLNRGTQFGVLPLLPIVIGATLALSSAAVLAVWINKTFGCELTIDARDETIRKEVDCSRRTGRVIIVTKDDMKVEIVETPPVFDLTDVMKAAVSGGADAVKQAVENEGAKAETSPA